MTRYYDAVVIGAGPAGMTAASRLAELGVQVLILDEQNRLGGQIYRSIESASDSNLQLMGEEYRRGLTLTERFHKSGAEHEPEAMVWQADKDGQVCYSQNGKSQEIRAGYVVIATGAMERPFPLPGWNLPGVMGAGAANNLAKEANLTPSGRVVLAGSGPLLLLEASLLIEKGVKIEAILETTPVLPQPAILPHLFPALQRTDFLLKGVRMLRDIKTSGVPYHKGVTAIRALGSERLREVEAQVSGKTLKFTAELLLLHFGVIPSTHLYRLIGCTMSWNKSQRYWYPACDDWGRTNHENIFAAGDGSGVKGALAAEYKGELAALEIARCCGILPTYERDSMAQPIRRMLKEDNYPRPFIDEVFAPTIAKHFFEDETTLCRCEDVTVGDVRKAVREGVRDVNEVKILTRCGMGPCQGRMCGPALAEIVAAEAKTDVERVGALTVRPPLKPIPLAEVAEMELEMSSQEQADLFKNMRK